MGSGTGAVIGLTGGYGAGKSTLAARVRSILGPGCTAIHLDHLRYHALAESKCPRHLRLQAAVTDALGLWTVPGECLDYSALYERVLESPANQDTFTRLVTPVLIEDAAAAITASGKQVVLLEWAMLLEHGFNSLLRGPCVLVTCSAAELARRAEDSGVDLLLPGFTAAIRALQPTDEERLACAGRMGVEMPIADTGTDTAFDAAVAMVVDLASAATQEFQACPAS